MRSGGRIDGSSYRRDGCAQHVLGWPSESLSVCHLAEYEPGSDEFERDTELVKEFLSKIGIV